MGLGQIMNYKCLEDNCKHEWEFEKKNIKEGFPEHLDCPVCGSSNTRQDYSKHNILTDIAEGKMGNAKNDYTTGVMNHHSRLGNFKGTTVKKI